MRSKDKRLPRPCRVCNKVYQPNSRFNLVCENCKKDINKSKEKNKK